MINKKENFAILIGLVLVIFVGIFTLIRHSFEKKEEIDSDQKTRPKISDTISPKELSKALSQKEEIVLIDLRNEQDFNIEHIIDSINIPYNKISQSNFSVKDKKLVIIATENVTANQAADFFKKNGALEVKILEGGISAWKEIGETVINWGDPTSFVNQSKVSFLDQAERKKMIEDKRDIEILDVRAKKNFNEFIPGAKNIPLDELEKRRLEISSSKEIIVYGETEIEAFMAGVRLYDMNFFSAYVLRGNFAEWKEKNYPTAK